MSATSIAASASTPSKALPGLANALVQAELLPRTLVEQIHQRAQETRSSFIATLIGSGSMNAPDLAHWVSKTFSLPLLDLDAF
ncbi:MAG: hypothetical protein ACK4ZS_05715, partial [Sulfurimicrobium sp.]